MFFVVNKEKLISYIIAFSTVAVLIFIGAIEGNKNVITTSYMQKQVPIYSVDVQENKIALTMNCAWNADDIDSILQTLKENNIYITFFVVGDWVDKYPEALKKIHEAGHEIGNHSNTHPHVNNLTFDKNIEQIESCSKKIENITGNKTTLYRGPYGEYNNTVLNAAKQQEHITIQWSIDTLDYNGLTEKEMVKRINDKIEKGSIILMHNGTANTATSLQGIINTIKEKGYEIVRVSDMIYKENYTIDANGMQHKE